MTDNAVKLESLTIPQIAEIAHETCSSLASMCGAQRLDWYDIPYQNRKNAISLVRERIESPESTAAGRHAVWLLKVRCQPNYEAGSPDIASWDMPWDELPLHQRVMIELRDTVIDALLPYISSRLNPAPIETA